MKNLLLSASVLAVVFGAQARAAGPVVPDFGQPSGLLAPTPASFSASGAPALPDALRGSMPMERSRVVMPGVNPFTPPAAAVAAPAPAGDAAAAATSFQPDAPPAAETNGEAAAADDPNAVDEAALRYYASTRDLVRVGAEIRRLKALHPEWQPPADLFASGAAANEKELWDLYAKKDFAGLDAAVAARAKANPGWKPSPDLAAKIDVAKSRNAIEAATAKGDWNAVALAAGAHPAALTCANMDVLWSLGEAYARQGNFARAFDLYAYILKTCEAPAERLATFQKASLLLPPEGAQALAGLGRSMPNGSTEFANLGFDPLRAAMGKVAAGEPSAPIDATKLQDFAAEIGRTRNQGDALLFGWYLYASGDFAGAAEWFKASTQLGPDPKAMEGYILSLRNGGQADDAAKLAYANRGRSPEIAKIYVEILSGRLTENDASATLAANEVEAFEAVVDQSKSALGAQSLGWNRLSHDDVDDARVWFRKSVEWQPTKEGVTGLAVVAARSKDKTELKQVRQRFGDDFPALASIEVPEPQAARAAAQPRKSSVAVARKGSSGGGGGGADGALMAEANAAFKAKNYARTIEILEQRRARYGNNGGAEVLRGWANLKLGRYDEARRVFKDENRRHSTKNTRFGIGAVSNEQYGMWE